MATKEKKKKGYRHPTLGKRRGNFRKHTKNNPTGTARTAENREKILQVLAAQACSLSAAAVACGVGARTVYEWKAEDEDFAAAINAVDSGPKADALEEVGLNHAINGVPEPVVFQGRLQYLMTVKKTVKVNKKTGKKTTRLSYEPLLDEKGELIPLTVTKYDHGLLIRMLDRTRPVAEKVEHDIGPSLEQLLSEMNKEDKKNAKGKTRKPVL